MVLPAALEALDALARALCLAVRRRVVDGHVVVLRHEAAIVAAKLARIELVLRERGARKGRGRPRRARARMRPRGMRLGTHPAAEATATAELVEATSAAELVVAELVRAVLRACEGA